MDCLKLLTKWVAWNCSLPRGFQTHEGWTDSGGLVTHMGWGLSWVTQSRGTSSFTRCKWNTYDFSREERTCIHLNVTHSTPLERQRLSWGYGRLVAFVTSLISLQHLLQLLPRCGRFDPRQRRIMNVLSGPLEMSKPLLMSLKRLLSSLIKLINFFQAFG